MREGPGPAMAGNDSGAVGTLSLVGLSMLGLCVFVVWGFICVMAPCSRALLRCLLRLIVPEWYDDKYGGGVNAEAEVQHKRKLEELKKVHPLRQNFETTRTKAHGGDPLVMSRNKLHSAGHRKPKRHKKRHGDPHPHGPGPSDHKTSGAPGRQVAR